MILGKASRNDDVGFVPFREYQGSNPQDHENGIKCILVILGSKLWRLDRFLLLMRDGREISALGFNALIKVL
ncbi:Putative hypothetical protein [Helicobacter mustelae 12198]|uniref:Uncharacterized protein n=1 Tax=Helicobacter mustelae (strain ATCC 43772 / CCUG 25715 / CIP 103759 / LMG 18044 / NCTC 12198 / R85-136P) TaxID=679897 RepID=D3UH06_HELM1|nr:Putative hypothetical protein [Helicobacter mustelae 12198]